ncbi:MAG: sensor domain-containing diguanylate cyclase [Tepidibacter sp.]|jgi:diguanylate cyclase (GGDEF)-like protein/PAS domain S-box-containing protein|uniref:sensor domain-containing diguanylate cyclase n=1 Tax=Tepidibacter sp. TaxID=2529387 RepID=UPI0025EA86AA|nr:sensor domain-containing diguanylate cyclase [Tepidibacter sp.]MCT4507156.1 sensor domain-containing diguanylate cyclase [Tepidibacter sp.]
MSNNIKLNRSEKKFQILFENSPIGMAMVIHATGKFIEVNPSLLKSTGYTKEEFLNLSYWDITPIEYEQQEIEQIEELNSTGKFGPNFKEYIRKDGTRYPIKISGFKLIDIDGTEVVWGLIEDISEHVKLENELKRLAAYDHLTGLINRRTLESKWETLLALSKREKLKLAFLTIDIDKFKQINDKYGHHFGDKVLTAMANRMQSVTKRQSDLVARIGGDEFIIILSDIHILDTNLLEYITKTLNQELVIDNISINISVSIGVALFPDDASSFNELYKISDQRAYIIKNKGGNGFKYL